MKSGWQDKMPKLDDVKYFDPRIHSPQSAAMDFVLTDINAVRESDLIFCYIEKDNPSGLGAAWECAIAYENDIPIITVWEKDYIDPFFASCSLYLYNNLESGVEKLNSYINKIL